MLDLKRCVLINHSKTPYECFKLKKNINFIISNDQYSLDNDSIIKFTDLRDEVYSEFVLTSKISGVKVTN